MTPSELFSIVFRRIWEAHRSRLQRQEHPTLFDMPWRLVIEVDPKVKTYAALLQEVLVGRPIATARSRDVFQSSPFLIFTTPPRF